MTEHAWNPDEELWERQPEESARAFQAFAAYRDMGAERSTAKVARALGRTKALCDRWSSRWGWVARVDAWDAEQDREQQRRTSERYAQTNEAIHGIGVSILSKIQRRLKSLNETEIDEMPLDALARLYGQATRAIRIVQGEPTERHAVEVNRSDPEAEREVALAILRNPVAAEHAREALRLIAASASAEPSGIRDDGNGGDSGPVETAPTS